MTRRWLSIWLPEWPIERMAACARRRGEPFPDARQPLALTLPDHGVPRLVALNAAARSSGLRPGMGLTDARAALPELILRDAEPWTDRTALSSLALWCGRWSPRTAPDGEDGILLDITGCAHLWNDEAGLLADVEARFIRLGFTVRVGLADRQLAAWAWTRFGEGGVLPCGAAEQRLAMLPIGALRLEPELVATLRRLGLGRVGQLALLPQVSLLNRFGAALPNRLTALLGDGELPFTALQEPRRFVARLGFAEPIAQTADIEAAIRRLLWQLTIDLDRAQAGVRVLRLGLHRVDSTLTTTDIRLGRPSRDARHLARLMAMRLDGLDVGFGVEIVILEAVETGPLAPEQADLGETGDEGELGRLADQLSLRLGPERVVRLEPVDSHIPERAQRRLPATGVHPTGSWRPPGPRPARLLAKPQPLDALAALPDAPPRRLRHGRALHQVVAVDGPERILPEWWRAAHGDTVRDYHAVTLENGHRWWVYRAGDHDGPDPPRWYRHGTFG